MSELTRTLDQPQQPQPQQPQPPITAMKETPVSTIHSPEQPGTEGPNTGATGNDSPGLDFTATAGNSTETRPAGTADRDQAGEKNAAATSPEAPVRQHESTGARIAKALSFRNISALYLFAVMFVIFALWIPDTFLTASTWQSLLANQSITCLVAVGLVLPMSSGVFDLAVGSEVGLGAVVSAFLLVYAGVPIPLAILLTLFCGVVVGCIMALLIVKGRINSFIATLGMSSVLLALINWVSGTQQILNVPMAYTEIATGQLFGIVYPVWILLAVALILWYVLERTSIGRRVYATGGNPDAARLAGVRTWRIVLGSTITCGVISGLAGLLITSQISAGDPSIGPGYLLPAIAAAVLGSTQLRGGRYNVWGTVIAAYVLATGVKGLQLAGAPVWIPDLFNGAALLIAVGMAQYQKAPHQRHSFFRRLFSRRAATEPVG